MTRSLERNREKLVPTQQLLPALSGFHPESRPDEPRARPGFSP